MNVLGDGGEKLLSPFLNIDNHYDKVKKVSLGY
jgi:hypothetical protein